MDILTRYEAGLISHRYAPATVRAKTDTVRQLLAWTELEDPLDLTAEDVAAWVGAHPRWKPWTLLKYLDHVRAFCRWASLEDLTEGIRRPPAPPPSPRPAPEGAVAALLGHRDARVRVWTALGAYAGLRSFESAKVAAEDVDGEARLLQVLGKGGQLGVVPLADIVLEQLAPWLEVTPAGRLWTATAHTVQQSIRRAAAQLGYDVTSHQLRHRYGTAFYAESRDLLLTRDAMRHRTAASTEAYVDVGASRAAAVLARLPGAATTAIADGRRPALRVIRGGAG